MAQVKTTQRGLQEGWIRTRFILNLVEEGSKEVKKTATLSILMLALMLAIMVLANGCAHRQTLQRCVERHGQPARVVEGEGGMVTWYYYYPGRSGDTIVLEVVGNSTTGLISQIKKYPVTQNAGLPKDTKQPSPPSGGTLKRTSPTTKQNAPSDARAEAPSGRKGSATTPNTPSAVRAGLLLLRLPQAASIVWIPSLASIPSMGFHTIPRKEPCRCSAIAPAVTGKRTCIISICWRRR